MPADVSEEGTPTTGVTGGSAVPYRKETVAEVLPFRLARVPFKVAVLAATFDALAEMTVAGRVDVVKYAVGVAQAVPAEFVAEQR